MQPDSTGSPDPTPIHRGPVEVGRGVVGIYRLLRTFLVYHIHVFIIRLVPAIESWTTRGDRNCSTLVESHAHWVSGCPLADICRVHPVTCQCSRHRVPSSRAHLSATAHGTGWLATNPHQQSLSTCDRTSINIISFTHSRRHQ